MRKSAQLLTSREASPSLIGLAFTRLRPHNHSRMDLRPCLRWCMNACRLLKLKLGSTKLAFFLTQSSILQTQRTDWEWDPLSCAPCPNIGCQPCTIIKTCVWSNSTPCVGCCYGSDTLITKCPGSGCPSTLRGLLCVTASVRPCVMGLSLFCCVHVRLTCEVARCRSAWNSGVVRLFLVRRRVRSP